MTIWLLQLPRLDDTFSWGLKEVQNILHDLHQPVDVIDINAEITKKFIKTRHWDSIEDYGIKGKSNLPIDEINKLKHNKFIPGVKIPIKKKSFIKNKKNILLVLAWNFYDDIKKNNVNLSEDFLNIKELESNSLK